MKRPTYLEIGRRPMFGRPQRRIAGPVEPPPDPDARADFDLGTWRVRPPLARMTRADRIVALDPGTLALILILVDAPPEGVNRELLAARIYGAAEADEEARLKRSLSFLRRIFALDGSIKLENAPGDCYRLAAGAPRAGSAALPADADALHELPVAPAPRTRALIPRLKIFALAVLIVTALGVATVYLLGGPSREVSGRLLNARPFADPPGLATHPAFAPDGRQVVYSARAPRAEGASLYIAPLAGGAPRRLTDGRFEDLYPVWSPAAARIAFVRLTGGFCEVMLIAPDGSGEEKLADCAAPGPVAFSRDGGALIYSHKPAAISPAQLVSISLATHQQVGVSNPTIGMRGDSAPALAPNGRRLAFVRTRAPGVADIVLIDGGGAAGRVTQDEEPVAGLAWLAGSRSILFAAARAGRSSLWRVSAEGGTVTSVLATDRELAAPAVSPDGRHVLYEAWVRERELVSVPLEEEQPASPIAADARDARLSPDGRSLAYLRSEAGRDALWLADASGANGRRIASPAPSLASPAFSPDGRHVALMGAENGRTEIYEVRLASGESAPLTHDGTARNPSFSRDGRRLYFASRAAGGRYQLWRRAWPEPGPAEQVTSEGGIFAIEAKDGDTLYYARPDRIGLWQRGREPGGDEMLVTAALAPADALNFAVTREAIYLVIRPDGEHAHLARFSLANKLLARLRALPKFATDSGLSASEDGHVIATREAGASARIDIADLE
jgi:Tol biopolymer transport system component/DNA-binding winged helix-turn-helix (wHTH) protein